MNEFTLTETIIKYVNEIPLHFRILIYYSILSYFVVGPLTRKWAKIQKKEILEYYGGCLTNLYAKDALDIRLFCITTAFIFAPITLLVFVLWKILEKTFLFLRYLAVGDIKE